MQSQNRFPNQADEDRPIVTDFSQRHFTTADGITIQFRDYGTARAGRPAVLCLPGLTRNSRDFAEIAALLAPAHRVICPDTRGRGLSDRDPNWQNYHPGTYVQDALQLLDHLGLDQVVVIGTSMGGLMAMMMAATVPHRLAGVVLNDVGPVVAPEGLQRIQGYVGKTAAVASWDQAVAQVRAINAPFYPDYADADWLGMARKLYRDGPDGAPTADYDPDIARGLAEGSAVPPDLWPLFQALGDIPTLALRGEMSDILSAETLAEMATRHPSMTAVTVANRGHAPMLDEPDARDAIVAFLDRLPAGQ